MHDRLNPLLAEHFGQAPGIGNISHDQPPGRLGHRGGITLEKVVIGNRVVTMRQEPAQAGAADVAGSSGQENFHWRSPRFARIKSAAAPTSGAVTNPLASD